jgi:hypothetical protein
MKTTIEIADPLLREACKPATREAVTLRALVERGLHHVVTESGGRPPFKLRRASFRGKGLQAGFRDASWEALRAAAYQDRSG